METLLKHVSVVLFATYFIASSTAIFPFQGAAGKSQQQKKKNSQGGMAGKFAFRRFDEQLHRVAQSDNLHLLRAAFLDFLFNYKRRIPE